MEIIETIFSDDLNVDSNIVKEDSCFLDIETTGLSRHKNTIYLIGILYFNKDKNSWTLAQIFANNQDKEKELLLATMDLLSNFNQIINYNGNSFDIPFINQRLQHHSIDNYISKDKSLDIYAIVRSNKNILNSKNLKLETIEEYLGIYRTDIYSGRDCIRFYKNYVENGEKELKDRILQHNYDDLYYLLRVVEIINILEDKKSFNILYKNESVKFTIDTIKHSNDFLIINGFYSPQYKINQMYYEENYKLLIKEDHHFEISIEIQKGLVNPEEISLFINRKEYPIGNIIGKSPYNLPEDIILLKIEKQYIIENIKQVILSLFKSVL